jgi:methyl-accepting chemotaxis protein
MSDYNDQIFQLWAEGRLDEGDAMSTGEKWDVFYVLDQAMTELVKSVDARATAAKQEAEDADSFTQTIAGGVTALAVLLGLLVAFVVSRGIVRGIQGVRSGLERLAAGDLAVRLPVKGRDEVGQMAVALNSAAGTRSRRRRRRPAPRPVSCPVRPTRCRAASRRSPRVPSRWVPPSGRSPRTRPRPARWRRVR